MPRNINKAKLRAFIRRVVQEELNKDRHQPHMGPHPNDPFGPPDQRQVADWPPGPPESIARPPEPERPPHAYSGFGPPPMPSPDHSDQDDHY